jgi:hypothetical protein
MSISEHLKGTRKAKARIKSKAIATLDMQGEYEDETHEVKVKILSLKEIDGYVEIMAQAWKGRKQIGFGADGSVDIERFRFFDPRILIDSPTGDIVKYYANDGGEMFERRLTEDPMAVLRQQLAHTAKVAGRLDAEIRKGKVGNTTTTLYPTLDGKISVTAQASFATARGAATGTADTSASGLLDAQVRNDVSTWGMSRAGGIFDTSVIGSDDISSAILSPFSQTVKNGVNDGNDYVNVDIFSPVSDASFASGDYDNFSGSKQASDRDLTGMGTEAYIDLTFTTYANINKTGNTRFMLREGHDWANSAPSMVTTGVGLISYPSEESGTSKDMKFVLVHAAPVATAHKLERTPIRGVMRGVMRP